MGYENLSQKLTFYKAFFSPQWKFLIHTILQCLSAKTIAWNEFSSTMDFEIICLATNQKFNFSKYIFNSMMKHLDSGNKFLMYPRKSKKNDTQETQPSDPTLNVADEALNEERVPTHSNDPLLSGEDSLKLTELLELCTNLQQRVIDLETTKTSQAQEIVSLKKRDKKLGKIKNLGEEDASKQGRIADIDANEEVTLVNESAEDRGRNNDQDMFDVNADLHVSTGAPITIVVTIDELTMAQALVEIKKSKPKAKGIIMQEPSEATTTTIPIPLKVQDKGKGIMVEEPLKMKKKAQILFDEEVAKKLQDEINKEERLARERARLAGMKAQQDKEGNIALIKQWHDVQAKIEADYELAQRLQAEEQEQLTDAEKARLFMEFLKKRRKVFAAKREIDLQPKLNKGVLCLVEGSSKKTKAAEGSSKRAGEKIEQENSMRQKMEEENESEELKKYLDIVPDDGDDVTIEATPLSSKSPTIVDYKIYKEGRKSYFQIIRANGNSQMYFTFSKMLKNFDREDLEVLWSIVKARFKKVQPVDDMDSFLLHNLKTMFEHHVEDNVWKNVTFRIFQVIYDAI
ncbi:hypothetical protein Tco_0221491 [Tanacetum coccineum]